MGGKTPEKEGGGREQKNIGKRKGYVLTEIHEGRQREREPNQREMKGVSNKGVKCFSHLFTWSVCLLLRTRCVGGVEVTTAAFLTACNPCTNSSRVT